MFNLKNKKDNAETITNFALPLLTAVLLLVFVVLFSTWMGNIQHMDAVNQVARKYILKMETQGGLTTEDETALRSELQQYCTNVRLDGTTYKSPSVKYGDTITLQIAADLYAFEIRIPSNENGPFMQMTNENGQTENGVIVSTNNTTPISIVRSSTSKH